MTLLQLVMITVYTCVWHAYKFILTGGFTVHPDLVVVTMVLRWFTLAVGGGMGMGGGGGRALC